jgi:hypothetical protein
VNLRPSDLAATVDGIVALQLPSGMIPWFPGGHADPWNHVEAAMALTVGGRWTEAERAYRWLVDTQNPDGSWFNYYTADGVEDYRLDTNVVAYVAVGVWQHALVTGSEDFLREMWPTVEHALDFVVRLQRPTGEILWCIEPDLTPGRFALLTGSSSIYLSLRCGAAAADRLGKQRPDWELAAGRLAHAIAYTPEVFEPKARWAMDWYYPVLCGAVRGAAGQARLLEQWDTFVMPERGVRCVSDRPWVTAAETAECVIALTAAGLHDHARTLFGWAQHLRDDDGMYWTGCVYPEAVHFPGGERSSYSAAAVLLAADVLWGRGPTAALFRGEGIPAGLDLDEPVPDPST